MMSDKSWFSGVLPDFWDNLDSVQSQVSDPLIQKLFRIFLMMAERSSEKQCTEVIHRKSYLWIHADEVKLFASILSHHLPAVKNEVIKDCQHGFYHYCGLSSLSALLTEDPGKQEYNFKEFAMVLAKVFPYNREEFMMAILIVYDNLINQVLKKGFLLWSSHKSGLFRTWQRRWVVIKPGQMTLYKNQTEQEKLKEIFLSNRTTVDITESKSAFAANGSPLFEFELRISSGKRRFLSTFDVLQRRQWITAIQYASHTSDTQKPQNLTTNVHRRAFLKRRQIRIGKSKNSLNDDVSVRRSVVIAGNSEEKATTSKTDFRNNLTVDTLNQQLAKERERANRLETEKERIQEQLEKQRIAVRDEEIVRELATRLFEEERSRRNAVEEMNKTYADQLTVERQKRQNLESTEKSRLDEIRRLKEELHKLQNRIVTKSTVVKKSSADERLDLLAKLKRDQEALIQHQLEIKNDLLKQQIDCSQNFEEAKSILSKLIENSKKRSITNCRF